MKKVLIIIARVMIFMIISLVVAVNLLLLNSRFVLRQALPKVAGLGYAIVLSGSMEPTFTVDDLLIIQEAERYNPDEIVCFVDDYGDLVTHRLVSIDDDGYMITKGDNNNTEDKKLPVDRIEGKVIQIVPGFGNVLRFLQNPFVAAVIVVVTLFLLELSYSKEKKQKKNDLEKIRLEIEQLKQAALSDDNNDDISTHNTENKKTDNVSEEGSSDTE